MRSGAASRSVAGGGPPDAPVPPAFAFALRFPSSSFRASCYTERRMNRGKRMVNIPSPAVSIVGRHNSGKTTLIEKLIAELVARGLDVGM